MKLNFKQFTIDIAISFVKKVGKTSLYLLVYVDDLLIIGNNGIYITSIKKELKKIF
jgi:hypothetical protein